MESVTGQDALEQLTPREREVLDLLRQGLSDSEIGGRLGISRAGASYHVSEIIGKLNVGNRHEAAAWPERPPWWAAGIAPVALLWRKATAILLIKPSSLAMGASAAGFAATFGGLGLIAILLLRGGNPPSTLEGGTASAAGDAVATQALVDSVVRRLDQRPQRVASPTQGPYTATIRPTEPQSASSARSAGVPLLSDAGSAPLQTPTPPPVSTVAVEATPTPVTTSPTEATPTPPLCLVPEGCSMSFDTIDTNRLPGWLRDPNATNVGHPPDMYVVRDAGEWEAFWTFLEDGTQQPHPAPPVDFEEEMVIALIDGHGTAGYTVTIDRVLAMQNEWIVEATHTGPSDDCYCVLAQLQSSPRHFVRVQRTDLPVRLSLAMVFWSFSGDP